MLLDFWKYKFFTDLWFIYSKCNEKPKTVSVL